MGRRDPLKILRLFNASRYFESFTAYLVSAALALNGCSLKPRPSAAERAHSVIETIEAVADPDKRELVAVYTFNLMCALSRAAKGGSDGAEETALANFIARKPAAARSMLVGSGATLGAIPGQKRAELLGQFSGLDPGSCDRAPDWQLIGLQVRAFLTGPLPYPRLHANFCAGGAGAANDARDITVGGLPFSFDPEFKRVFLASGANPVVLGVEGEHVVARHPKLAQTNANPPGNGLLPYGVVTDIPCDIGNESGCDPANGLLCGKRMPFSGPDRCMAFPVVQKDQEMVLRGYNYWDVEDALLRFSPVIAGQGVETFANLGGGGSIEAGGGFDAATACPVPTRANATHDRAHFRVGANENAFYQLKMFNRNGQYHTQRDAQDDAAGRVLHVCYPDTSPFINNLPPGTIIDCAQPVETCPQDGADCATAWTTPPRALADCQHAPGQTATCGETPAWFQSELLTEPERDPDYLIARHRAEPIVYVANEDPTYVLTATLDAVESRATTDWEWFSDEPMVLLQGISNRAPAGEDFGEYLERLDKSTNVWKGEDFDDTTRRENIGYVLNTVSDVGPDDELLYVMVVGEDDGRLLALIVGGIIIAVAGAVVVLTAGVALWAAIGGAVIAMAIWEGILESMEGTDEIGALAFTATPLNFDERIADTHRPDFLNVESPFGPLPLHPDIAPRHLDKSLLLHPFVSPRVNAVLASQCNPGACSGGRVCLIGRCVEPGFVSPLEGKGFKERRQFTGSGSLYGIDVVFTRTRVAP